MASPSEEELRARIAAGSREADGYEELARVLGATGRFEESLAVLRHALELSLPARDRARVSLELGWGLYEKGPQELAQALALAREAAAPLEAETTTAEVLYLRGAAQCLLAHCLWWSDEPPAREAARLGTVALEQAIQEAPGAEWVGWAHYDAGRTYALLSEGQQAISHLHSFLSGDLLDHDRLSGTCALAEALRVAGQLEEAERAVEEALRLAARNPDALPFLYVTRAFIHRDAGQKEEARRDLELALEALVGHPARDDPEWLKGIHGHLGDLYYEAGDYAKAAAAHRQLLVFCPEGGASHAAVLHGLGQCHFGLGEYAEARRCFEAVLAAPSVTVEYRVAAERDLLSASAHLARTSGDHEKAAELFRRILDRHPEDVTERHRVVLWLAHSLYALERYDEALHHYDEVAGSPHAEPGDRAQAEEWSWWSSGYLRYGAGELAEAAEAFGHLVDAYPADHARRCSALLWLAACYLQLGARVGARACYEAVLAAPGATESERTNARGSLAALSRSE